MIVGISGLAGSGKDTFARFLVEGHGFVVVSLADPLKRICREVFDFTEEQLWGPSEKRNEPDKRYPRENEGVRLARAVAADLATDGIPVPPDVSRWAAKEGVEYLTPRHALQQLGTNWGRDCYENVWVEYTMRTAKRLMTGPYIYSAKEGLRDVQGVRVAAGTMAAGGVAIPDVRFRNEIEGIRAAGGKVIRIRRPGAGLSGAAALHPSEVEQASIPDEAFDLVIENTGTLEELRAKAAAALPILRP